MNIFVNPALLSFYFLEIDQRLVLRFITISGELLLIRREKNDIASVFSMNNNNIIFKSEGGQHSVISRDNDHLLNSLVELLRPYHNRSKENIFFNFLVSFVSE